MALYQKSVQSCPNEAFSAWLGAASIHLVDGEFIKAEITARQAEMIQPKNPEVLTLLASSLARQHKFEEALKYLERILENASNGPNRIADARHRISAIHALMSSYSKDAPEQSPNAAQKPTPIENP